MKRQNLRTVSLIVVTFTYLLIGAAIFGHLECEHETRQRETLELIELIVKRKYNISEDDFTVLTTTVIKSVPHKAGIQWKFSGAFYFATTVVTTIGYGHSTPATLAGRSFCMIYALIGIPLGLVMFQSIGERLNTFVGAALRCVKRCLKAKNPEVTQTNLVMVVLVLSTILMTSMAAVFAKYERWDYFDALYYCFITLTTIGFGDYVALQKESALQSKPEYVALSLIFILFGLSVVSSAVNLLVLKFLTLNTEDERRDERLRYTAALNPIQLEGDIIVSSGQPPPPAALEAAPAPPLQSTSGCANRPQERLLGAPQQPQPQPQPQPQVSQPPADNLAALLDCDFHYDMSCSCSLDSLLAAGHAQLAAPCSDPIPPAQAGAAAAAGSRANCLQCLMMEAAARGRAHEPHREAWRRQAELAALDEAGSARCASRSMTARRPSGAGPRAGHAARQVGARRAARQCTCCQPDSSPVSGFLARNEEPPSSPADSVASGPRKRALGRGSARLARSQPQVARLVCRCCCEHADCARAALHRQPDMPDIFSIESSSLAGMTEHLSQRLDSG